MDEDAEDRRDQILMYVAGQLEEPAAVDAVRAALDAGRPETAAQLAEAEATVTAMLRGLAPVAPPAEARKRLMQRVRMNISSADSPVPEPVDSSKSNWWPALSAIAAGLAIGLGIVGLLDRRAQRRLIADLMRENNLLTQQVSMASAESQLLESQVADLSRAAEMLKTENLKLVSLSAPTNTHGDGRIFWDQTNSKWLVAVHKLDPLPPDKVYELWFINKQGQPLAAGEIKVDTHGDGTFSVAVPPGVDLKAAGISSEPRSITHTAPTTVVALSGTVE